MSGTASLSLLSGPTPSSANVSGGGSQSFRWTWRGTSDGNASFQVGASGTDATDGRTVTAAPASSGAVSVQPPATLSASLSLPGVVGLGETFTVTMTVRNDGGAGVVGATPSQLTTTGTATATLVSGPTPASAPLAAGQSQSYTWQYTTTSEGTLTLSGSARGTDANSGITVVSPTATSSASSISRAIQLASNPFGDGTSFSFVFKYDEHVYMGPNKDGRGGVRTLPDGSGLQSFSFSLPRDVLGNYSANTSSPPYPSIGRTGCIANTPDCGPDDENGRGLFFTGTINGQEWLTASGVNTGGNFDYPEMTTGTDSVLDFRYVDLNSFVGGQARGISSARVHANNIYLGLPDTTGNRPGIIVLHRTPDVAPGLDVPNDSMAQDLDLDTFEYFGANVKDASKVNSAPIVMVDAMAEFNNRLYLANNGGCVRTTRTDPGPYGATPSHWATCRPTDTAYTGLTSITLESPADITPADRAVPQMAVFDGKLYMARNTTVGPQLFACSPGTTPPATDCDAGDWTLVAPNASGNTQLTQFNTPGNTHISLLVATSAHLYVGFDNVTSGLVIFRTANPAASARGDFQGLQDCSAADAPTCRGLGGNGLGVGATRIFDGSALTFSSTSSLYLVVGTGTSPVRLFRIAD